MKAFTFFDNPYEHAAYPKQLAKIIDYLENQGTININITKIEDYYREFSNICYSAGWMTLDDCNFITHNDQELLDGFAYWLSEQDI